MRASRHSTVAQPATRVDTTCWQLFRPAINTAHCLFFVAEVMSNYLTTDGLKNFFTSGGPLTPVAFATWLIRHSMEQGFASHSTQNRSFQRRSSQPINWLATEKNQNPTKLTTLTPK